MSNGNPRAGAASSAETMRFRLRKDLIVSTQEYGGQLCFVLKDPVTLAYFRFAPKEYRVIQEIQGRTIPEICTAVEKLGEERPTEDDVKQFLGQLMNSGLVTRDGVGDAQLLYAKREALRRQKRRSLMGSMLYIKFPGVDPTAALNWLHPMVKWMYSPLGVAAAVSLMLFAAGYTLVNLDQFVVRIKQESLESFFSWSTLAWLWVALGVSKIVHEFGHGLTCKHFGGECHEMGVLLLVFTPCLYCDTTDAWTMPNKWHRIAISMGGIYVELIIASVSALVWWHTAPGTLHTIAFALMTLCSLSTFLVNANPLMRYDGYYILADLMEIPNLRQKSNQAMQAMIDKHVLGLGASSVPQVAGRKSLFITYAILAWLYRWLLCAVILWFFYNLLKPYRLSSISIALACVVGLQMVVLPIWKNAMRVKNTVRSGQPVRWARALASAVVLAGIGAAIVFAPIPRRVWGVLTVEGAGQQPVFVPVTGRLDQVAAQPGDTVQPGDVLVQMSNPELDLQIQHLEHRLKAAEVSAEKFFALGKPGEEQSLQTQREEILEELRSRREQRDRLTVRAETGGTVVPAQKQKPQKVTSSGYDMLVGWTDHPLDTENVGAQLPIGTLLCELQPREEFEAVLLIEQSDISFLKVGQPVSVKLDAFPGETFLGRISQISAVEAEDPPEQLLITKGGELPAKMKPDGGVGLQSTHYEVRASLDGLDGRRQADPHNMLRYGLRGRAKIQCGEWTAWEFIVREVNQLFHF